MIKDLILLVLLSVLVILGIVLIILNIYKLKLKEKFRKEYINKHRKELEEIVESDLANLERARNNYQAQVDALESDYKKISNNYQEMTNKRQREMQELMAAQDKLVQDREKNVDEIVKQHYLYEQAEYERRLREMQDLIQRDAEEEFRKYVEENEEKLLQIKMQLDEWQAKQNTINEQILQQRALDEQQDFYRICITSDDCEDIEILRGIRNKLHRTAFLDKIIYDTFVSKYVKEMAKRVLQGKDPSGIYKVTNIKTNEIYIGKSTNVATRWVNHTKSAYGLEGVADSQFQRALKQYGVQNFTWELVEAVPKNQLTTREKFYISFYNTIEFGYNQRVG